MCSSDMRTHGVLGKVTTSEKESATGLDLPVPVNYMDAYKVTSQPRKPTRQNTIKNFVKSSTSG